MAQLQQASEHENVAQAPFYDVMMRGMGIINPVLDAEAQAAAASASLTSLPPRMNALDPSYAVGKFADMIKFTKEPVQAVLNWRSCPPHKRRLEDLDLGAPREMFDRLVRELEQRPGNESVGSGMLSSGKPSSYGKPKGRDHHQNNVSEQVSEAGAALAQMAKAPAAFSSGKSKFLSPFHSNDALTLQDTNTFLGHTCTNMGYPTPQHPTRPRSPYAGTGSFVNPANYPSISTSTEQDVYPWIIPKNASRPGSRGAQSQKSFTPPTQPSSAQEELRMRTWTPPMYKPVAHGPMPQLAPKPTHTPFQNSGSSTSNIDPALLFPSTEKMQPAIHQDRMYSSLCPTTRDGHHGTSKMPVTPNLSTSLGRENQNTTHHHPNAQPKHSQHATLNLVPKPKDFDLPQQSRQLTPAASSPSVPPPGAVLVNPESYYQDQEVQVAFHNIELQAQQRIYQQKLEAWHRMQAEEKERQKSNVERIARNKEDLTEEIRKGNDVLAYRYHDYMEAFPLLKWQGEDRTSEFHRSLLANDKDQPEDRSEAAMAVRYAKAKWWNYWQKKDRDMVIELMKKDSGGNFQAEMNKGGHLITAGDMEGIRRVARQYEQPSDA